MTTTQSLLSQVEKIYDICRNQAIGIKADEPEYIKLRKQIISNAAIRQYLPEFIIQCRDLKDLLNYFYDLSGYEQERQNFVCQNFRQIFEILEFRDNQFSFETSEDKFKAQFPIGNHYDMWNQEIPVLLPQAWIQWHSSTKKELREANSSYADDLYRVDFVAFWNNIRFAILVDDISHYAKKNYSYWNADEEKYSMRLKEDRKLRKEGWEVFRVSNWEIGKKDCLLEILEDLLNCFEIYLPLAIEQSVTDDNWGF